MSKLTDEELTELIEDATPIEGSCLVSCATVRELVRGYRAGVVAPVKHGEPYLWQCPNCKASLDALQCTDCPAKHKAWNRDNLRESVPREDALCLECYWRGSRPQ